MSAVAERVSIDLSYGVRSRLWAQRNKLPNSQHISTEEMVLRLVRKGLAALEAEQKSARRIKIDPREVPRIDKRRMRAEQMTHHILRALERHIPDSARHDAFYSVLELLYDEGVEVVTDHHRAELGLPPRGPDGWTDQEIVAMEHATMALMLKPIIMEMPK